MYASSERKYPILLPVTAATRRPYCTDISKVILYFMLSLRLFHNLSKTPVAHHLRSVFYSTKRYLDFPNAKRAAALRDVLEDLAIRVVGTAALVVLRHTNQTLGNTHFQIHILRNPSLLTPQEQNILFLRSHKSCAVSLIP